MADLRVEARAERKRRASVASRIARVCNCEWPLVMYRNRHGHHPECPVALAEQNARTSEP